MKEELYAFKEIVVKKYKNYLFPELERHISNYLCINEDKIDIYANSDVPVEFIVRQLLKNETIINSKHPTTDVVMGIVSKIIERGNNGVKQKSI